MKTTLIYDLPDEPQGYGAFDEDQLYERPETVELPDEVFLNEETNIEGAKDSIQHIKPISLR
jgi:hypothetical protein